MKISRKMKHLFIAILAVLYSSFASLAQSPTFELYSPLDSVLTNGTTIKIKWVPPSGVTTVRITLSPDASHGTFITQSATNSGEYVWIVNRQGYDARYYSNFSISVSGCTTNYWCGTGYGPQFTIVDKQPAKSMLSKIEKVFEDEEYSYFEIDGTAEPNFTHFLECSWDMEEWYRLTDSATAPSDGILQWYVRTAEKNLFFRVATVTK